MKLRRETDGPSAPAPNPFRSPIFWTILGINAIMIVGWVWVLAEIAQVFK